MEPLFLPPPLPYSPYGAVRSRPRRASDGDGGRRGRRARDDRPHSPDERAAEIERIATQLGHIARTVPWGRVQGDEWDRHCQYIFRLRTARSVRDHAREAARQNGFDEAFVDYALRRWYCFWGSRVAELLFLEHPGVEPGPPRDHEVDFAIDGVPFDLKTSELPRAYVGREFELVADPAGAAQWMYENQSRQRRFHMANRLFLVLCDPDHPDAAWRLRADVPALRAAIDSFMARREVVDLTVTAPEGSHHRVLTAVIPVVPQPTPRELSPDPPTDSTTEPPPMAARDTAVEPYQLALPIE